MIKTESDPLIHEDVYVDEKRVAVFIHDCRTKRRYNFITEENDPFQFGSFFVNDKEKIFPHQHNENIRTLRATTEFIYVLSGQLRANFYSEATGNELKKSIVLSKDSGLIIFSGVHGFEALGDCQFFEVKQGPYNEKKDKVRVKID